MIAISGWLVALGVAYIGGFWAWGVKIDHDYYKGMAKVERESKEAYLALLTRYLEEDSKPAPRPQGAVQNLSRPAVSETEERSDV
jgi:hypothetical protein